MRRLIALYVALMGVVAGYAENWDEITESGKYYYGEGTAATEAEADKLALADLSSNIAVNVSSGFEQLMSLTNNNGNIDQETRVKNCIETYTYAVLQNVSKFPAVATGNNVTVRRYMLKSELDNIYEARKAHANTVLTLADNSLEDGRIDQALRYYYAAYLLVSSIQHPEKALDANGMALTMTIPSKIESILHDVTVEYEGTDDSDADRVNLLFRYQGHPVKSLVFSFNDGREIETGNRAKDGRGCMEMIPRHIEKGGLEEYVYHIDIEYMFADAKGGDKEIDGLMAVVPPRIIPSASKTVKRRMDGAAPDPGADNKPEEPAEEVGLDLAISDTQVSDNAEQCDQVMQQALSAIKDGLQLHLASICTAQGMHDFTNLIGYGEGRIVGTPNLKYYKSFQGYTMVRGLQMSFVVGHGKGKRTFVEDVVFAIDGTGKICNITFGLGNDASNDILANEGTGWKDYTKEMLIEFLENYRTAYCMQDLPFLKGIFSEDAEIVVGKVLKMRPVVDIENRISLRGQNIIDYNRFTKDEYMKNLERVFANNEFINLKFGKNDIQWLEKYPEKELFAINIRQEYVSSIYSDKGYLFLLVDMTDHDEPLIKVRTWQPNEVPLSDLYNAGDFTVQ